jgi:hypothetical protein
MTSIAKNEGILPRLEKDEDVMGTKTLIILMFEQNVLWYEIVCFCI